MNPKCDQQGIPVLLRGEEILVTKEIAGTIKLKQSQEFKVWGTFYLTNARMIIINYPTNKNPVNFALHLNLLSQESTFKRGNDLVFRGKFDSFLKDLKFEGSYEFYFTTPYLKIIDYLQILLYSIRFSKYDMPQAYIIPENPDQIIIPKK